MPNLFEIGSDAWVLIMGHLTYTPLFSVCKQLAALPKAIVQQNIFAHFPCLLDRYGQDLEKLKRFRAWARYSGPYELSGFKLVQSKMVEWDLSLNCSMWHHNQVLFMYKPTKVLMCTVTPKDVSVDVVSFRITESAKWQYMRSAFYNGNLIALVDLYRDFCICWVSNIISKLWNLWAIPDVKEDNLCVVAATELSISCLFLYKDRFVVNELTREGCVEHWSVQPRPIAFRVRCFSQLMSKNVVIVELGDFSSNILVSLVNVEQRVVYHDRVSIRLTHIGFIREITSFMDYVVIIYTTGGLKPIQDRYFLRVTSAIELVSTWTNVPYYCNTIGLEDGSLVTLEKHVKGHVVVSALSPP